MEADDGEDVDEEAEGAGDPNGAGQVAHGIPHLLDDKVEVVPAYRGRRNG